MKTQNAKRKTQGNFKRKKISKGFTPSHISSANIFRPNYSSPHLQENLKQHPQRCVGGFTLIEMMVAVSIFSVVMVISAGSIFAVLDANAKSQAVKSVLNNLNLALEGMARNIRAGSNYHCGNSGDITAPQDCLSGATYFAFESTNGDPQFSGDQVVYRLSGTQIQKSTNGGSTFLGITAPSVIVQDLKFYVDGSATDNKQPRALIIVRGYAGIKDKIKSSFNIQTTVSQRLLDIAP